MAQKTKVYYDADCKMCQVSADMLNDTTSSDSYELINVHTAELPAGLEREKMLEEIYITLPDGTVYTNADAVLHILNSYWYMKPLVFIGRLPGVIHVLRMLYRTVAKNRYIFGHTKKS